MLQATAVPFLDVMPLAPLIPLSYLPGCSLLCPETAAVSQSSALSPVGVTTATCHPASVHVVGVAVQAPQRVPSLWPV